MSSVDPTRRTLLAGSALALTAAAAAEPRSVPGQAAGQAPPPASAPVPKSGGPLSVREFGAIGDGYLHPLSERFAGLEDARRIYPFATALDQTLDWAAIQAAVNAAVGRPNRQVHLPAGHYVISNSIRLPNGIDFFGDGPGITFLDNEVIPLKEPQLVNAAPSFVGVAIRQMSLHGGTHALKVSVPEGEITWLTMEGVACVLQTDKNVECDRLLQSSDFRNCSFVLSPYGVYVAGHTTNAVNFLNCGFEQHSQTHLHLAGAEGVNFYGGKFEAGGQLPNPSGKERATIFLENAGAVNFHGVYFEATHEILLKELRSRGGVSFQGCHFTGAGTAKGLIPYRFVSDGLVTFGTNDWNLPSEGPARIALHGYNGQRLAAAGPGVEILSRSPRQQRAISASQSLPPSGILPLATVSRVGALVEGTALVTGELVLHGAVQVRPGGTALVSRRYHLRLSATAAGMSGRIETASTLDDAGIDLTVRLRARTAEIQVVEAVLRGASAATLQWSLETLAMPASSSARLEVDVPGRV
jgi:hypothetical protein